MRKLVVLLLLGGHGVGGTACQCWDPRTRFGTSLFVVVDFEGLTVDQLAFSVSGVEKTTIQPEPAGGRLTSPQTMRLLVADSLDGTQVTVSVLGLFGGSDVARGENVVLVHAGIENDVVVTLAAGPITDGGPTCGPANCSGCCRGDTCLPGDAPDGCGRDGKLCAACSPTDTCSNGLCDACNQPTPCTGCCSGSTCVPMTSLSFCGASGGACAQCDGIRADSCSNGQCSCGGGVECEPGQHCAFGVCRCDGIGCGSCCEQNQCRVRANDHCAPRGADCRDCTLDGSADSCSPLGLCQCGGGPACGPGQKCHNAQCECDATSCPGGCCEGGQLCVDSPMGNPAAACGAGGNTCFSCPVDKADGCGADGGCLCGSSPACQGSTRCTNGSCVCNATTCPFGCCTSGGLCVNGRNNTQCGSGGASCGMCDAMSTCTDAGVCSSCNASSCDAGCCSGSSCLTAGFPECGGSGALCTLCDSRSNRCGVALDGGSTCACGSMQTPCLPNQLCAAGVCQCDRSTCPGCCKGTSCLVGLAQDATNCGPRGGTCAACNPATADGCGPAGDCRCGPYPECGDGLRCTLGLCKCNTNSGCSGCCATPSTCVAQTSLSVCGASGSSCTACDPQRADSCVNGSCRCGNTMPCGLNQQCVSGSCVCNATSCSGCCAGNLCVTLLSPLQCGSAGAPCLPCAVGLLCLGGVCR